MIAQCPYVVQIALKDRALLESTPSVRAMPRQKAPAVFIAAGAFPISVLAHKRKTQLNSSAEGGSFLLQFETSGKSNRKLAQSGFPVSNRQRPFFGDVRKGKVQYLQYRRIIRKRSLGLNDLTQ